MSETPEQKARRERRQPVGWFRIATIRTSRGSRHCCPEVPDEIGFLLRRLPA